MYEPIEAVNDYAVDHLPVDFEMADENIVIFQDLDQDSTFEEANVVIEQALADIDKLNGYQKLVAEAITNPDSLKQKKVLTASLSFRNNLEHRYAPSGLFKIAAETFHSGYNVIVALEAEKEAQKGIFKQMIDAIVKAFKWMWDKFAAMFKDKIPNDIDKRNSQVSKVKDAESNNVKPEPDTQEDIGLAAYFPEMDGVITAKDVNDKLDSGLSNIDVVIKMYDVVSFSIEFIKAVGEDVKRDGDQNYSKALKANEDKLDAAFRSMPSMKREEAQTAGIVIPETVAPENIHGLSSFVRGGKFVIWLLDSDNIKHPKSAMKTMKAKDGRRSFKIASSSELANVSDKVLKLINLYSEHVDRFTKSTEVAERFTTDVLPNLLKDTAAKIEDTNTPKEKIENLRFAMKIFSTYSQDIGSLINNITSALRHCGEASILGDKYISFSSSKYGKPEKKRN